MAIRLSTENVKSIVKQDQWNPKLHWSIGESVMDLQTLAQDVGIYDLVSATALTHFWLAEWTPASLVRTWINGA